MLGTVDASYARCREIHREHGKSYYLATKLLPEWKRRHVHALYGLTRHADDIVDVTDNDAPGSRGLDDRAQRLGVLAEHFRRGLTEGEQAVSEHPILPAVVHTVAVFGIEPADFDAFFASMTMDLTRTCYPSYDDLLEYMEGSAAVIGTMMLPILGPVVAAEKARTPARELGFAFQLTNFIRDIGEDLDRGRIYLPLQDLQRFGIRQADLQDRVVTPRIRALLEFEMARAQRHYADAAPGIEMLAPSSRGCIRTAFILYREILDAIRNQGYDVFARRARVPMQRKLAVAARELARSMAPMGGHL